MKTRQVPRFSLAMLLVAAAIFGAGGGSFIRAWYAWPVYKNTEVGITSGKANACWKVANRSAELQYLVVIGDGYRTSTRSSNQSRYSTTLPIPDGLTTIDERLYADDQLVEVRDGQRCFVYGHRNQMIPVPIPDEELQEIAPDNIRELAEMQLWKDHIQPIIEAERAAYEEVVAASAEEKRRLRESAR